MKRKTVLMVGCGDLGCRAGRTLLSQGFAVAGLRRQPDRLPPEFTPLAGDYLAADGLALLEQRAPDFILASFKPDGRDVAGYQRGFVQATRNLLQGLGGHRPEGILWVSSTRVLAESRGGVVAEHSELATDDAAAAAIVEAERLLQASGLAVTIMRFAGIYGDPGGRLLARVAGGDLCAPTPVHFSNRIHREDAGAVLAFLLAQWANGDTPEPVYLGVDNLPTPQYEVERWLATELAVTVAPCENLQATGEATGKRCDNSLLRASGFRFSYPDYRSGYAAVLRARQQDQGRG